MLTIKSIITLGDILEQTTGEKAGVRYLKCCAYILSRYREKPKNLKNHLEQLRSNLRLLVETVTATCVDTVVDDLLAQQTSFHPPPKRGQRVRKERFDRKHLADETYVSLGVFLYEAVDALQDCLLPKPPPRVSEAHESRFDDCKIGLMMAILFDLETYAISAMRSEFLKKNPIFGKK